MKSLCEYRDNDGQVWEVLYEEHNNYAESDGEFVEVGPPSYTDTRWRRKGEEEEWLGPLPPFATFSEDAVIQLSLMTPEYWLEYEIECRIEEGMSEEEAEAEMERRLELGRERERQESAGS